MSSSRESNHFTKEKIFLHKLKNKRKIQIVESSDNIAGSYTKKSVDSLVSAKLLFENELYENSISMSYYAMYNLLLALLFKVGIKSENHTGSIFLLRYIFDEPKLTKIISQAKKERIDKQYYVTKEESSNIREIAHNLYTNAEFFCLNIKVLMRDLNNEKIKELKAKFFIIFSIEKN